MQKVCSLELSRTWHRNTTASGSLLIQWKSCCLKRYCEERTELEISYFTSGRLHMFGSKWFGGVAQGQPGEVPRRFVMHDGSFARFRKAIHHSFCPFVCFSMYQQRLLCVHFRIGGWANFKSKPIAHVAWHCSKSRQYLSAPALQHYEHFYTSVRNKTFHTVGIQAWSL